MTRLTFFHQEFAKNADPERAAKEKAYLKSPDKFYGLSLPNLRKIARDFKKNNPKLKRRPLLELVWELWAGEYHEEKTLAIELLRQYKIYLDLALMPRLEKMLNQATGWSHIDEISIHLVGEVLGKDRRAFGYLEKWATSANFWVRRAALISQILLFRKGEGDRELFFRLAQKMIEEKEFFIRKAIGWTLREMAKTNPDEVYLFLDQVKDKAAGLTLREGSKRLTPTQRARLIGPRGRS